MHTQKVKDTIPWMKTFMERNRLYLLVSYTAFLESYLKEITFFYTASKGYIKNLEDIEKPLKLTSVGDSISSPLIRSSTVPDMIKYASEYYDVNFGSHATEWIKIYKIRCASAHNGGIATPKFLREIGGNNLALNPKEYEKIGLTWDELRTAMKYGDDIAAIIDSKVSSYEIKILEADQIIRELYQNKRLPKQKELWKYLFNNYSLHPILRKDKNNFIRKFYQK